jgi:hypothetical protein
VATLEPISTMAYWGKAVLTGPSWWPLTAHAIGASLEMRSSAKPTHFSGYTTLHRELDEVVGKGMVTGEAVRQWRPMMLGVETAPKLGKVLLARLPSCTQAPRTLGQALPVTRGSGESSHQRWAEVTRVIYSGQRRSGSMMMKPRAKQPHNRED